jgi:hypothetical protein
MAIFEYGERFDYSTGHNDEPAGVTKDRSGESLNALAGITVINERSSRIHSAKFPNAWVERADQATLCRTPWIREFRKFRCECISFFFRNLLRLVH